MSSYPFLVSKPHRLRGAESSGDENEVLDKEGLDSYGTLPIGHFRVPWCLCFQNESECETILMKMTLICMKMKLHAEVVFI